jgi:hypothetical protein
MTVRANRQSRGRTETESWPAVPHGSDRPRRREGAGRRTVLADECDRHRRGSRPGARRRSPTLVGALMGGGASLAAAIYTQRLQEAPVVQPVLADGDRLHPQQSGYKGPILLSRSLATDGHSVIDFVDTPGWGPWSRYAFDMKRKRRIDQSVVSVERHKKRYLAALAKGRAPTVAARIAGLARSTVYKWRREDAEFAAAWADSVEQGLDLLEDRAYQRAMKNSDQLLMFQLRARRPEVYGRSDSAPKSNVHLQISLEEHFKRLERLGVPLPVIEGDYEEDDAPPQSANHP